jgi:hypothetical protein
MATISLTGADTISIDGVPLVNLADGDVAVLTYPNSLTETKKGKNGNAIISRNETGDIAELVIRILRASPDDKTLNSRMIAMEQEFASFVTLTADLVKKMGDGAGNVSNDIFALSGGSFSKKIETTSNVEGNTDQAVAIYTMTFVNSSRAIA